MKKFMITIVALLFVFAIEACGQEYPLYEPFRGTSLDTFRIGNVDFFPDDDSNFVKILMNGIESKLLTDNFNVEFKKTFGFGNTGKLKLPTTADYLGEIKLADNKIQYWSNDSLETLINLSDLKSFTTGGIDTSKISTRYWSLSAFRKKGDHDSLSTLDEKNFSSLANKPTTLSGYGITDAYSKTELQSSGSSSVHWNNVTNKTDAAADGTTKGLATFYSWDFDAVSGIISIDYAHGQLVTGSVNGFVSPTMYNAWNSKQPAGNYQLQIQNWSGSLSGLSWLEVGTVLSVDTSTFAQKPFLTKNYQSKGSYLTPSSSLNPANVSQTSSYRFATDTEKGGWNNAATNSHTNNINRLKLDSIAVAAAILNLTTASFTTSLKSTYDGYATTLSGKVSTTRSISTTLPLTGGGDLSADRTLTIASGSITGIYIQDATITGSKIGSATITGSNIASGTITSTNIADGTIAGSDIGSATITGTNIASATISGGNITDLSISAADIENLTITAGKIANATITGAKIEAATITGGLIANATIGGSNIAGGTITGSNIAGATITGANIAAATITGSNISNSTITGGLIDNATITGAKIAATTITASNIAANTITASQIASATITATQIASGTITATQIATGTITATQIASGTITTSQLNFTPVQTSNVVSSINSSAEGITINANKLTLTGVLAVGGAAADVNAGTTTISGGKITANTITTSQLNFTPVQGSNVISSINSSAEGITINANKLTLTGVLAVGGAAADVNAGTTTISGGKITASSIAADRLSVSSLSSISANIGTITAGSINGVTLTGSTWQTATGNYQVTLDGSTGNFSFGMGPGVSPAAFTGNTWTVNDAAMSIHHTTGGQTLSIINDDQDISISAPYGNILLSNVSIGSTKYIVNSTGQMTKVNNIAASGNTGKALISDGTSFTPTVIPTASYTDETLGGNTPTGGTDKDVLRDNSNGYIWMKIAGNWRRIN